MFPAPTPEAFLGLLRAQVEGEAEADPTRLTDGIEPSDDPILHIRSHVYSESTLRRTGVGRPDTLR